MSPRVKSKNKKIRPCKRNKHVPKRIQQCKLHVYMKWKHEVWTTEHIFYPF